MSQAATLPEVAGPRADAAGTSVRARRQPRALWPWLCLAPAAALVIAFDYWPLARTFFLSTQGTDIFGQPSGYIGAENFAAMAADPGFWHTIATTFAFTVFSVAGKLAVGLALALPLSSRLKGTRWMRPLVVLPMALSVAVAGLVFRLIYQPRTGFLDQAVAAAGGQPVGWLTDSRVALGSIVAVDVWTAIGLVALLLLAALDGVPSDVLEAASLDGAGPARITWSIRLPLIMPTVFFLVVTQSISAMREFTLINLLTGGGPNNATKTLVMDIYHSAFGSGTNDYSSAAARGIVLLIVIALLFTVQKAFIEKKVHYA